MKSEGVVNNRPLSPHLSIYKPQITSVLSIMHRFSGVFLYLGLFVLSWYIIFSIFNQVPFAECYLGALSAFFGCFLGKVVLFAWNMALFYHFYNGIRHLFWDMGVGFSKPAVVRSGICVIVLTLVSAIVSWFYGFNSLVG